MAALMEHFQDMLKDVYYAEKQIYKTLPKMVRASSSDKLKEGFQTHRDETEGQIDRLEQVFGLLELPVRGKKCPAIDGILEEGAELIEEHEKGAGLDAALAAAAQAVEHYEIARYGTLCTWADTLGLKDVKKLLGQTLDQEEKCDKTLTDLAEAELNSAAAMDGDDENGMRGKRAMSGPPPKSGAGAKRKPAQKVRAMR